MLAERGAQGGDEKPPPSTVPGLSLSPHSHPASQALTAAAVLGLSPAPSRSLVALPDEDHLSYVSCYSWNTVQVPWV